MNAKNIDTIERILKPFIDEALPWGGINMGKSLWQKSGRGYGGITPYHPDIRYIGALVEALYRTARLTGNQNYHKIANNHVRFMANFAKETDFAWVMGTVLQSIGFYHQYNNPDAELAEAAKKIVCWVRKNKVKIDTGKVTFDHFPCGYGWHDAKDAGWTNDLSICASGLVWAYEVTGDKTILDDAISFAEYFIQPWQASSLGDDGYWHAGTWNADIGSWVIGPLHYNEAESTNSYTDESSWLFSTFPCTDYLIRLYNHKKDSRFIDLCTKATQWVYHNCQFADGAFGLCGRDDKWYGCTGYAISQLAALIRIAGKESPDLQPLVKDAKKSFQYLSGQLYEADLDSNGVDWVSHTTLADPMVNVGWLWIVAVIGIIDGDMLFE